MMAQPDGEATTSVPTGRCGKHRQSSLRSLRSLREIRVQQFVDLVLKPFLEIRMDLDRISR
jgi:hypothetical protein